MGTETRMGTKMGMVTKFGMETEMGTEMRTGTELLGTKRDGYNINLQIYRFFLKEYNINDIFNN